MAKILIACEESQTVAKAFRARGHEAYSCDLLPQSGGHPEWHIQGDVLEIVGRGWDLMVAHPPCTFLTVSGVRWLSHPEDKNLPFEQRRPNPHYPDRRKNMLESVEFVKRLYDSNINRVAIENPIGLLSSYWRKPDQTIHPYMFGDKASKATCFWLKNLPKLTPTNIVEKGEFREWIDAKTGKKKRQALWIYNVLKDARSKQERQTLRSKTFQGIADAIADQWGCLV